MRSEILKKIIDIDPSNIALKFINHRIQREDYRGFESSQHNRYDIDVLKVVLTELYEISGDNLLQIRTTDLSKRPYNIEGEAFYAQLVANIHRRIGRTTQDSLRKNLFLDFSRAGFIIRYNKDKEELKNFQRSNVKYVKISELGKRFINAENFFQKYLIFSEGLNNLLQDLVNDLMIIISSSEVSNRKITIEEFMYFISFIGKEVEGEVVDIDKVLFLIKEYRRLPVFSQKMLKDLVVEYCNPNLPALNKKYKRDYHNWKNKSVQTLNLLNQTSYFIYSFKEEFLMPRIGKAEISPYETEEKFIRSSQVKKEYFINHKIKKEKGFELHHTIPVSFAKTKEEFALIDDWKNLLYIDGYKHAIITQMGSSHYILRIDKYNANLINALGHTIELIYKENVIYNIDLLDKIESYNKKLRSIVS